MSSATDRLTVSAPAVAKWIAVAVVAQWAQVPQALQLLVWLMLVDYVFGVGAAIVTKELSSRAGLRGLIKKGMVLGLLLALHLTERYTGIAFHVEQAGALGYSVNELVSIVENSVKAGIPIPEFIVQTLVSVKNLRAKTASREQIAELEDKA